MTRYKVAVTETVKYLVPVDYDGEFDEAAIEEAAIEALIQNDQRDTTWFDSVEDREAVYVGQEA